MRYDTVSNGGFPSAEGGYTLVHEIGKSITEYAAVLSSPNPSMVSPPLYLALKLLHRPLARKCIKEDTTVHRPTHPWLTLCVFCFDPAI